MNGDRQFSKASLSRHRQAWLMNVVMVPTTMAQALDQSIVLCVGLVLTCGILVSGCDGHADLPRNTQTVDGVTVYLGVMPSALIQGHSTAATGPQDMHEGAPKKLGSNHIVVALFDAESGARITDARIRARVADRSDNHEPGKDLELMQVNGAMTYGNFFPMKNAGVWRIHLEIVLVDASRPIVAEFAYEHAPDR